MKKNYNFPNFPNFPNYISQINYDLLYSNIKNLKFEQNKSFTRYNQHEAEKPAQQSDFSKALFATEVNKSTNAIKNGEKEFHIAMPKKVVVPEISKDEASQFQAQLSNEMKYEISDQYKRYLLKKYPVELDKKNSQEIE